MPSGTPTWLNAERRTASRHRTLPVRDHLDDIPYAAGGEVVVSDDM
jgi:hypothetical protein